MSEKKQIEEIAKDLCPIYEKYKSCKQCDTVLDIDNEPCVYKCMAEMITAKKYRKQNNGRWKGTGLGDYYCSLCCATYSGGDKFNYCPNCGAKMKGDE